MAEFWYNIEQFNWNKNEKVFRAEADRLLYPGYAIGFPNQGRQFFMINRKTHNFRRFRLKNESNEHWVFETEDNIQCIIKKSNVE